MSAITQMTFITTTLNPAPRRARCQLIWLIMNNSTILVENGKFNHSRSIQPLPNFPLRIQRHALTTERPAHVADAHEIRRRHAVRRADLHAQQRRLAAKTHRADAEFVRRLQNVLLQRVPLRLGVAVVEPAEKLRLAQFVTRRAVAAD